MMVGPPQFILCIIATVVVWVGSQLATPCVQFYPPSIGTGIHSKNHEYVVINTVGRGSTEVTSSNAFHSILSLLGGIC